MGDLHEHQLPPPPPLPRLSSCRRHPDLPVTGFCASCLRERLQVLDPNPNPKPPSLRRCKSFSFARDPSPRSSLEPHRRSCDVRSRASALFPLTQPPFPDPPAPRHPPPRPMRDHIDLEAPSRRAKRGSVWLAASALGRKLQSWRRKQKPERRPAAAAAAAEEYPPGRRSCDTDPRFSLDAARISLDCPPDLPRASWDGHLLAPRHPPAVPRSDGLIPVEEDPGGTLQTREYYAETSQRRRRSLDRSASLRKPPAEEHRSARVSNYECSDSFDFREPSGKGGKRWWSLWGLIQRHGRPAASDAGVGVSGRHSFSGGRHCYHLDNNGFNSRNRSSRYSPGRLDNGMLRFYLTPVRSTTRRPAAGTSRVGGSAGSLAGTVLRLY